MSEASVATLVSCLQALDYARLFLFAETNEQHRLWDGGRQKDLLVVVALDAKLPAGPRFLASEMLAEHAPAWPDSTLASTLGPVYAQVLSQGSAANGNSWGLPGVAPGAVARHVLRLGQEAASAFVPLLDDSTGVRFEGSEEATLGNAFGYRVKDIAASLIAALRQLPFAIDHDPNRRDAAIAALRLQVSSADPGAGARP